MVFGVESFVSTSVRNSHDLCAAVAAGQSDQKLVDLILVSYRWLDGSSNQIPSVRARAPHTPHTACSLYTHYGTRRAQKTLPNLTRAATSTRTAKFENQKRYSRTSKTKRTQPAITKARDGWPTLTAAAAGAPEVPP